MNIVTSVGSSVNSDSVSSRLGSASLCDRTKRLLKFAGVSLPTFQMSNLQEADSLRFSEDGGFVKLDLQSESSELLH